MLKVAIIVPKLLSHRRLLYIYPGGRVLASTISSELGATSSFGPNKGDLGRAMSPVLVDSSIPKGATSFKYESTLSGFADLWE